MSRIEGREKAELGGGFQVISDGWHQCAVGEGIDLMKNKEGELVVSKFGGWNRLVIPIVVSEEGEEDGRQNQIVLNYKDPKDEQKLADIIASCGMWNKFVENFNLESTTLWDDGPFTAFKTKIQGKFLDVLFKSKEGKDKDGHPTVYVNPTIIKKVGLPRTEDVPAASKTKSKDAAPTEAPKQKATEW
jgi:hypothetical protein